MTLSDFLGAMKALRFLDEPEFAAAVGIPSTASANWPAFRHNPASWLLHYHADHPEEAEAVWREAFAHLPPPAQAMPEPEPQPQIESEFDD